MQKASIEPPKRKTTGKGEPPPESQASDNLGTPVGGGRVALNMEVPAATKTSFKVYATIHGHKNMGDLFDEVWRFYQEHHKET